MSLDTTLLRLASMLEREVDLRGKIKSAMTYPIAVVVLVLLIMCAMLLFVVPQFKGIYSQLGGTLPLPTRILLFVSEMFEEVLVDDRPAGAIAFRFFFRRYKKTDKGRDAIDALKLRVPVFGIAVPQDRAVAVLQHAGDAAASGVPILQALDIVVGHVNNRVIARAVTDVQTSVREGESIAKPLGRHAVFPPMVVQMIAVGEETGQVDTMLEKVAQFYDQEVEAAVDALTSLIEPHPDRHHRWVRGRGRHRAVHADVQHHQADQVSLRSARAPIGAPAIAGAFVSVRRSRGRRAYLLPGRPLGRFSTSSASPLQSRPRPDRKRSRTRIT